MTATDADRIAARGVTLTLRDGRTVHLRYSMRSLAEFERRWGSIEAVTDALNALIPSVVVDDDGKPAASKAANRKPVSTVVPVLAIGLGHEGITEDALLDGDLLDFRELSNSYLDAIGLALNEAFPPPEPLGKGGPADRAEADSTGPASTTQPPSVLVAATTPSGA